MSRSSVCRCHAAGALICHVHDFLDPEPESVCGCEDECGALVEAECAALVAAFESDMRRLASHTGAVDYATVFAEGAVGIAHGMGAT